METLKDKKVVIEYPTSWQYKLVGLTKTQLQNAVKEVILEREHTIKESKKSSSGKYVSMNLDLVIQNEDERLFIFDALKQHAHIKFVL